jgi:peptidoglycan hydrolase CwlO-like protein
MRIDMHHYIHLDGDEGRLSRIEDLLTTLVAGSTTMSAQLDTLKSEVTENTAVIASAVALIEGLSAQILALKDDPVALAALAAELDTSSNALAAAVAANTPAAPV